MEKFTKRDYFNAIRAILAEDNNNDSLVAFIDHELELLEKKNASRSTKPTAKQIANASIADEIYDAMQDGTSYTISDIKALIPELANANPQKVSAIVSKMRKEIRVSRELVKGKAYFTKI